VRYVVRRMIGITLAAGASSGIRPIDQLIRAICGMTVASWLLREPGDGRSHDVEAHCDG
jgi:hypothetical protein